MFTKTYQASSPPSERTRAVSAGHEALRSLRKRAFALHRILDVGIDQERVTCLKMNVLHHDLEVREMKSLCK